MATSAIAQSTTETNTNMDIKPYNETYRVYVQLTPEGKINEKTIKVATSGKDNSAWNALDADTTYQKALEQTVKMYDAGSIAGISLLVEDAEEAVNIFNRGVSQKLGQKLKATFTELTADGTNLAFDPEAGAFDSLPLLNDPTRRRNLSPLDKAKKAIRDAVKALFPGLEGADLEARVDAMLGTASGN